MNIYDTKLGDKIRHIRKNRKLTQNDFGRLLGVSDSTVALWENNKRNPDIENLLNVSKLFNVSIDWLLSTENKTISINVPKTENTITIMGRNGDFDTYIVDDAKKQAIKSFTETLAQNNPTKKN